MSQKNKQYVPVHKYYREPFEGWENTPYTYYDLILSPWLVRNSATLLWGDGDLTALALDIALQVSWNMNLFLGFHPQHILYLKGEIVEPINGILPKETKFTNLLNQIPQSFSVRTQSMYRQRIQTYPEPPPLPVNVESQANFYWRIVNPKRIPWGYSHFPIDNEVDLCRELFSGRSVYSEYSRNLKVVFLDGFEWKAYSEKGLIPSLKNMIKQLQARNITTIVVSRTPPKNVINSKIWDNVLEARPWRKHKCGGRNILVNATKYDHQVVPNDFYPIRLMSPKDKIQWEEIYPAYYDLIPGIKFMVSQGKSSKQILEVLRGNHPKLTLPTLARLRREWGISTYKQKKKSKF
jgi:hypothetical protein